jgi:hypothetical protein
MAEKQKLPVKAKKNPPDALHQALRNFGAESATIRLVDGSSRCWNGEKFIDC